VKKMQAKRYTDDVVEIEAFRVNEPGGKWLVFTSYIPGMLTYTLGQMVKRCDDLPTEYPDCLKNEMVPIKWKNWTGEGKEFRMGHAEEFLGGLKRTF
jgi:hypothetical protein